MTLDDAPPVARPALADFLGLIARCIHPMSMTTGSPMEVTTSDGATITLVVNQHPWDDERIWEVRVRRPRLQEDTP